MLFKRKGPNFWTTERGQRVIREDLEIAVLKPSVSGIWLRHHTKRNTLTPCQVIVDEKGYCHITIRGTKECTYSIAPKEGKFLRTSFTGPFRSMYQVLAFREYLDPKTEVKQSA